MEAASPPYRGRFAPSPTGPLHLGSMFTALASFLQARFRGGHWHVRIDDLDTPRCLPGAADGILRTLERFGLLWDGKVTRQSRMREAYEAAIKDLDQNGLLYPCSCSRKSLAELGPVYPGRCRHGFVDRSLPHALRVRVGDHSITFYDRLQGRQTHNLAYSCGDFIVRRRDRIHAYQLAVVIDDARLGVSEVLRGCDLLDSTPRQIHLQRLLGLREPAYSHIPILVDDAGQKLSKQTGAPAVENAEPGPLLHRLLHRLGQDPPQELQRAPAAEILSWAIAHWDPGRLSGRRQIAIMPTPEPTKKEPA